MDSIQHAPRLGPQQAFLRATLWCFLLFCLGSFSVGFCSSCAPGLRILATQGAPARLVANPRSQAEATATTADPGFRVLTFNAGLAPGVVPRVDERAAQIARGLTPHAEGQSEPPFDVACLQEVWLERHAELLQQRLGSTRSTPPAVPTSAAATPSGRLQHPVWLSFPPEPVAGLYCADSEVTSLVGCVAGKCRGETDAAGCALSSCRPLIDNLSASCVACLSRDLSDPLAALAGCTRPGAAQTLSAAPSTPRPGDSEAGDGPPARAPKPYLLGGAYGVALVSRLPVLKHELLRFESTMHPRGVIYARVLHPELGAVDTYCTHLTPLLRGVRHPAGGSFVSEQSAQVERLLEITKPQGNVPVVLLGDLNTGPAGPGALPPYQARLPQHYSRLLGAGLLDATSGASCTFCYDNPIQAHPDSGGLRIDHVLTRGGLVALGRERLRFVSPSLSDHYGIEVVLGADPSSQQP